MFRSTSNITVERTYLMKNRKALEVKSPATNEGEHLIRQMETPDTDAAKPIKLNWHG